jgi:hypothetical protein
MTRSTSVTRWRCTLWGGDGFRGASRLPLKRGECEQREFRARVIEERPNREGWKARISEAGTHAEYDNSPSSTFRLSSSDKFTPESLGPNPARTRAVPIVLSAMAHEQTTCEDIRFDDQIHSES